MRGPSNRDNGRYGSSNGAQGCSSERRVNNSIEKEKKKLTEVPTCTILIHVVLVVVLIVLVVLVFLVVFLVVLVFFLVFFFLAFIVIVIVFVIIFVVIFVVIFIVFIFVVIIFPVVGFRWDVIGLALSVTGGRGSGSGKWV